MTSATAYLHDVGSEMRRSGYTLDCVQHACNLAQLLLESGGAPWIGRLREVRETGESRFHAPLTPAMRLGNARPTWTTHYVCCANGEVYDPMAMEPLPVDTYAETIFGRPLPIEPFLDAGTTAELLRRGELRKACR